MLRYTQPPKKKKKSTDSGKVPANYDNTNKDEWWIVIERCVYVCVVLVLPGRAQIIETDGGRFTRKPRDFY